MLTTTLLPYSYIQQSIPIRDSNRFVLLKRSAIRFGRCIRLINDLIRHGIVPRCISHIAVQLILLTNLLSQLSCYNGLQATRHNAVNSPVATLQSTRHIINVIAFSSGLSCSRQCSGGNTKVWRGQRRIQDFGRVVCQGVQAVLQSSTKVLVFEDPQGPIYKSLSLFLDHKVLEIFKDFAFCKLSIMYDKNSVTAIVHEDTVKNVLLTDVRYYLLIYVSK